MSYGPEHWHCQIGHVKPHGNIALFPNTVAPELPVNRQPEDGVIDLLQDLLDKALRGELRAVAAAYVKVGDYTSFAWSQGIQATHQLGASISDLAFAYAAARSRIADEHAANPGTTDE